MAYRTAHLESTRKTAEAGIVDDMVRQFADPYAFLRELVQNGIDAGATRIEVRIDRDIDDTVITSVDDDGCGMTREIIEGPLLTLFSSSKEKDESKIGKYGIGFVSVFALGPEYVDVITRRDPEQWRVRLLGDHSYELMQHTRDRVGTTVSIAQRFENASLGFGGHVAKAEKSLSKWCRHAALPITLTIVDAHEESATRTVEINEPLLAAGIVVLTRSKKGKEGREERFSLGVGKAGDAPMTFAGFYNRGLTLFETLELPDDKLHGLRFKVDSPALSHTLSRDNVKRDREYTRILAEIVELANELRDDLLTRIEAVANAIADSPLNGALLTDYRDLIDAATLMGFLRLSGEQRLILPLVEPHRGKKTIPLSDVTPGPSGSILACHQSTSLTRALAEAGYVVVHSASESALRRYSMKGVGDPAHVVDYVATVAEGHAVDEVLGARLVAVLKASGRSVAHVRFAVFTGVNAAATFRVVGDNVERAFVVTAHLMAMKKRPWGRSATLFLNVEDAAVRLARRRAKTDVDTSAHLLARIIHLSADGALSEKVVDRLLDVAGVDNGH